MPCSDAAALASGETSCEQLFSSVEWLTERRVRQPIKCFGMPLKLRSGELTLPGNYIYATRATPADTFRPFASRMALLRVRCQSFAERHRTGNADETAGNDRRGVVHDVIPAHASSHRPRMCNCTLGNLEILGSHRSLSSRRALRSRWMRPGMTA